MTQNKKILIVDDVSTNIEILLNLLSESFDVLVAMDGESALEIAGEEEDLNLILLDIMMPEMDGYEVCRRLKLCESTKDIPVVFITAKSDEESIEDAFDVGGSDYVTKPFKPRELMARIKKELELKELQDELQMLSCIDPLTKLYNRRHMTQISSHIVSLAKRENQTLSVLMLDIDKFKDVNDTYGHDAGDDVLIAFANQLKSYQRKSDIIVRFGGEEFIVILPNTSLDGAIIVAQKIREEIDNNNVIIKDNDPIHVTTSCGISVVDFDKDKNIENALKRADEALYVAKNSGRNRVEVN